MTEKESEPDRHERLQRRIDWLLDAAEKSEVDYETRVNTVDLGFDVCTHVILQTAFQRFEVQLGERGGLRRAEYNTGSWGEGEFVGEQDTKAKAWNRLLKIIKRP